MCGAGGITVPRQPSWPRTTLELTDAISTSRIERRAFRTPTRKKTTASSSMRATSITAPMSRPSRVRAARVRPVLSGPQSARRAAFSPALPAESVARLRMRTGLVRGCLDLTVGARVGIDAHGLRAPP